MNVMILSMTGEVLEPEPEARPVEEPGRDAVVDGTIGELRLEPAVPVGQARTDARTRRGLLAMQCLAAL